jgi:hypothetical protein
VVISHIGLGLIVFAVAGLRLYQSANPRSLPRSLLISLALVLLAGDLWLDALFQSNI